MERNLGEGTLRDGFSINNHVYRISIPENTKVVFGYDTQLKIQRIDFGKHDISLFRTAYQGKFGKWIANVYGRQMLMDFDYNRPPYPISYFK